MKKKGIATQFSHAGGVLLGNWPNRPFSAVDRRFLIAAKRGFRQLRGELADNPTFRALRDYFRIAGDAPTM
jgi:hypothetical protein